MPSGEFNYTDTFIAVSDDCPAEGAAPPTGKRSVAEIQYAMLVEAPYRYTQADVLFASSAAMREDPDADGPSELRAAFFAKPQACLRASPLPKRWGWGIHFNAEGKAAAYAVGSEAYRRLAGDASLTQTKGMRSKKP